MTDNEKKEATTTSTATTATTTQRKSISKTVSFAELVSSGRYDEALLLIDHLDPNDGQESRRDSVFRLLWEGDLCLNVGGVRINVKDNCDGTRRKNGVDPLGAVASGNTSVVYNTPLVQRMEAGRATASCLNRCSHSDRKGSSTEEDSSRRKLFQKPIHLKGSENGNIDNFVNGDVRTPTGFEKGDSHRSSLQEAYRALCRYYDVPFHADMLIPSLTSGESSSASSSLPYTCIQQLANTIAARGDVGALHALLSCPTGAASVDVEDCMTNIPPNVDPRRYAHLLPVLRKGSRSELSSAEALARWYHDSSLRIAAIGGDIISTSTPYSTRQVGNALALCLLGLERLSSQKRMVGPVGENMLRLLSLTDRLHRKWSSPLSPPSQTETPYSVWDHVPGENGQDGLDSSLESGHGAQNLQPLTEANGIPPSNCSAMNCKEPADAPYGRCSPQSPCVTMVLKRECCEALRRQLWFEMNRNQELEQRICGLTETIHALEEEVHESNLINVAASPPSTSPRVDMSGSSGSSVGSGLHPTDGPNCASRVVRVVTPNADTVWTGRSSTNELDELNIRVGTFAAMKDELQDTPRRLVLRHSVLRDRLASSLDQAVEECSLRVIPGQSSVDSDRSDDASAGNENDLELQMEELSELLHGFIQDMTPTDDELDMVTKSDVAWFGRELQWRYDDIRADYSAYRGRRLRNTESALERQLDHMVSMVKEKFLSCVDTMLSFDKESNCDIAVNVVSDSFTTPRMERKSVSLVTPLTPSRKEDYLKPFAFEGGIHATTKRSVDGPGDNHGDFDGSVIATAAVGEEEDCNNGDLLFRIKELETAVSEAEEEKLRHQNMIVEMKYKLNDAMQQCEESAKTVDELDSRLQLVTEELTRKEEESRACQARAKCLESAIAATTAEGNNDVFRRKNSVVSGCFSPLHPRVVTAIACASKGDGGSGVKHIDGNVLTSATTSPEMMRKQIVALARALEESETRRAEALQIMVTERKANESKLLQLTNVFNRLKASQLLSAMPADV